MERTILFYADSENNLVGATLLDENREPVDGYTGIQVDQGIDYVRNHPSTNIEFSF